ncbi:MAG: TM2 domain-containing protein [Akkermansiaceae bacterium]
MSEENQDNAPAPDQSAPPAAQTPPPAGPPTGAPVPGADKKMLAGLLAIFLGAFGVHKFILGYKNEGIIMAAVSGGSIVLGVPLMFIGIGVFCFFIPWAIGIVGLIEGIMYLTKSDEEFVNTYITNKKPWF